MEKDLLDRPLYVNNDKDDDDQTEEINAIVDNIYWLIVIIKRLEMQNPTVRRVQQLLKERKEEQIENIKRLQELYRTRGHDVSLEKVKHLFGSDDH